MVGGARDVGDGVLTPAGRDEGNSKVDAVSDTITTTLYFLFCEYCKSIESSVFPKKAFLKFVLYNVMSQ